jgi:anti-sigma B factor antagonist
MEITNRIVDTNTIIELCGELDGKTAPLAQKEIIQQCVPNCRIILDMTAVPYMSSAGLRLMLSLYRQIGVVRGRIVLLGIAEEIRATMQNTGFLTYFTLCDTLEQAEAAIKD